MRRCALALLAVGTALVGCSSSSSTPSAGARRSTSAPASPSASSGHPTRALRLRARLATWRLPAPRSREVVVATAQGLVVAGGLDAAKTTTPTVWVLDAATGRVRSTGQLATAVHDATGFALGGASYVVAGGNLTTYDTVQQVNPAGAGHVVGHLPRPRSDLVSTTVGRSAFVLGGFDGTTSLPQVLRTSDGMHFSVVASLRVTVRYAAVVATGGSLLVFGGEHDGVSTDAVQRIDLRTGRTTVVGHLPRPLSHEAAFVLAGEIWLAGGRSDGVLQQRIMHWDPLTRRASGAGRLPYAVADAGLAVAGGSAYLVGGETPNPTSRVVRLDAA